jgi:hypothetical protein
MARRSSRNQADATAGTDRRPPHGAAGKLSFAGLDE